MLFGCGVENTRVVSNTYTLYESINSEASDEFLYHAKHFKINKLYLASSGGNIYEALKIADVVERNNISVEVKQGQTCMSACTFSLLAGKERVINGIIGVHAPSYGKTPYRFTTGKQRKDLDKIKSNLLSLANRNGVKESFIIDSYNTHNENMMYMSGKTFNDNYVKIFGGNNL